MKRITIRADGGMSIGSGHLFRMLALAEAGAQVRLVTSPEIPEQLRDLYREAGAEIVELAAQIGSADDVRETAAVPADWICLDGYNFKRTYRQELRRLTDARIMWVDDVTPEDAGEEDAIFNQNFYAAPELYRGTSAHLLLGPRHALMRRQFRESPPRPGRSGPLTVLISLGWTVPLRYVNRALRSIAETREATGLDVRAIVLAGGQTEAREALAQTIQRLSLAEAVRIQRPVSDMVGFLEGIDLAISAAGTTLFELAFCGIPAVTFPIVDNQLQAPPAYAALGLGLALGFGEALEDSALATALIQLVQDAGLRETFAANGRALVDGRGAPRVAQFLTSP